MTLTSAAQLGGGDFLLWRHSTSQSQFDKSKPRGVAEVIYKQLDGKSHFVVAGIEFVFTFKNLAAPESRQEKTNTQNAHHNIYSTTSSIFQQEIKSHPSLTKLLRAKLFITMIILYQWHLRSQGSRC